jgi:hypothetical protein
MASLTSSVQQQRNGFTRFIVNPVERLGSLVPCLGIEHVSQRLLGAMEGMAIICHSIGRPEACVA